MDSPDSESLPVLPKGRLTALASNEFDSDSSSARERAVSRARFHTTGVVFLNVGGHRYVTSLQTLTRFPDSMLAAMFSGRFTPSVSLDKKGTVFIDRNGKLFQPIIDYLRCGSCYLPQHFMEWDQLLQECDFYQLHQMSKDVQNVQKLRQKEACVFEITEIMRDNGSMEMTILGDEDLIQQTEMDDAGYVQKQLNSRHMVNEHTDGKPTIYRSLAILRAKSVVLDFLHRQNWKRLEQNIVTTTSTILTRERWSRYPVSSKGTMHHKN